MVEMLENVRGKDVFVLQSTCAPTNDNLMELLVMVDALKRSSAARVTAAIPYFGYARQDRRPRSARVGDQRQGGGQHARLGGRGARADDGPARRPDPGLLRHAGRQHLRRAGAAGRRVEAALRGPDRGVARRRRRGARARARQAPGVRPRDHRQAPAEGQRLRSDERDRRGEGPHLRDHGRHGGHRRHAVQGGARC